MCKIYEVPFQEQFDAVEQYGEKTIEEATTVPCDPPKTTSRIAESPNLEYDLLSLKDINVLLVALWLVMELRAYGHKFQFVLHFNTWYEQFKGEIEEVVDPPK